MSLTKTLLGFALILPLLLLLSACGGVTTTAPVNQPVTGIDLAADTTTGTADGYVYIPVSSSRSRLIPGDIVISTSATPALGFKAAVPATVEISSPSGRSPDSTQTNSRGYYAFLRVTPGNYNLVVTVKVNAEDVSTSPIPIVIALESITHGTDAPVAHGPFPGFTVKHVDLSTNHTWQDNHDRIESIEDIQVSFTATNNAAQPATLDLFVSQTGALTPVTVVDTAQVPRAYHIYSFALPVGTNDIPSNPGTNQQTFRNQVLTGNFFLYLKVDPPQGESFTISNLILSLKLKIKV